MIFIFSKKCLQFCLFTVCFVSFLADKLLLKKSVERLSDYLDSSEEAPRQTSLLNYTDNVQF